MIGQAIRDEKLRRKVISAYNPEETLVTANTLNHLLTLQRETTLPEIELRRCVEQLHANGFVSIQQVSALLEGNRVVGLVEASKAKVGIKGPVSLYELLFFGPVAASAGAAATESELRRVFELTDLYCSECTKPITVADKEVIRTQTDLDGLYYCDQCRKNKLHKCENCDLLTQSARCKNCRSSEEGLEVI